jgi:hypothetical protein
MKNRIYLPAVLLLVASTSLSHGQQLDDFTYVGAGDTVNYIVKDGIQFNGYTNYWHNTYHKWIRTGNLNKMAIDNVEHVILQSKVDVADEMGVPGLIMQEGFIHGLLAAPFRTLEQPGREELEGQLENGNVLVFLDAASSLGKELTKGLSERIVWPEKLMSHQYGAVDLKRLDAFYLQKADRYLFVVSSTDEATRDKFKKLLAGTRKMLEHYDMRKGWFGAYSLLKSVTITPGHPLEIMGRGMNEGNTWFVFDGYMDFIAHDELKQWVKEVDLPVVVDVGHSRLYGCEDYEGLQVQRLITPENWFDFARRKNGYVFRNVYPMPEDPYHYDGYIAEEGNKEQIDGENVPFILKTGRLENDALYSMVLFLDKGEALTFESMWEAILDRREVGILEKGKMMGPAFYRNALQLLWLDRIYLEEYFGDRVDLEARVEGYELKVTVSNTYPEEITGSLELTLPDQLKTEDPGSVDFRLPARSRKTYTFAIQPDASAMGRTNPIAVHGRWDGKEKSSLAMLDLPPAISVHQVLYGHATKCSFPVTLHNFTKETSFPVKLQLSDIENDGKVIFEAEQTGNAAQGTFQDFVFALEAPPGAYNVRVTALGQEFVSQLGVGEASGNVTAKEVDVNGDGVNEFELENDSVKITLLATGARVIDYTVKSRDDNVLFKLWPEKAIDDKRPFRERGFYPYGGFEDFLGQASMETHWVYDAEIIKRDGDYVRVRMWADYYGNRLEKTFTLYGNTPLLEVRFALTFKDPYANVIGPQPILELGERHSTEDLYTVPTTDGLVEIRMYPERTWGQIFYLSEGWHAGYETRDDIAFVGAYPVDQPLYLHMFLNHPRNRDSHYYYAEFQPWTPILPKSTMYFTYYLWGAGGRWEKGVDFLRERNLITKSRK